MPFCKDGLLQLFQLVQQGSLLTLSPDPALLLVQFLHLLCCLDASLYAQLCTLVSALGLIGTLCLLWLFSEAMKATIILPAYSISIASKSNSVGRANI